jgi:hypothetical protein
VLACGVSGLIHLYTVFPPIAVIITGSVLPLILVDIFLLRYGGRLIIYGLTASVAAIYGIWFFGYSLGLFLGGCLALPLLYWVAKSVFVADRWIKDQEIRTRRFLDEAEDLPLVERGGAETGVAQAGPLARDPEIPLPPERLGTLEQMDRFIEEGLKEELRDWISELLPSWPPDGVDVLRTLFFLAILVFTVTDPPYGVFLICFLLPALFLDFCLFGAKGRLLNLWLFIAFPITLQYCVYFNFGRVAAAFLLLAYIGFIALAVIVSPSLRRMAAVRVSRHWF